MAVQDWNRGQRAGLVDIGSHKLFLSVSGPDRQGQEPVVIIMGGVTSSLSEWPAAIRLISKSTRTVGYDRSGFGQSEESPNKPEATTIAAELSALLKAAGVGPPYVMLGHSWGGVLITEFASSRPEDIAGMIFVDAGSPRYFERLPVAAKDPAMIAITAGVDYVQVAGVEEHHALLEEEWQAFLAEEESDKHARQAALELQQLEESYKSLAAKGVLERKPPLLGNRPVCVVHGHSNRDFKKMYEVGVAKGNGSEHERETFRQYLETWEAKETEDQKEVFGLSDNCHWMESKWCGHNVQLLEPDVIADAVSWTMSHLALPKV